MKVFAHYIESEIDGECYRWRTLLQFGGSWDIIGSVYMQNPGSAAPIDKPKQEDLEHLKSFDKADEEQQSWRCFSADPTMWCIRDLFCEAYRKDQLSGVIQIFNLMNMRTPNASKALEFVKSSQEKDSHIRTTDGDIKQLVAPIYLGWGTWGASNIFKNDAERILQRTCELTGTSCYHQNYNDNKYYHPRWLMRFGKNMDASKNLRAKIKGQIML